TRGTPGGGAPRGPRDCRQRSAQNRASPTAVEKTLRGKVGKQTFPLRLGIPQKTRDSHFPTAATTTALRLHFKWRDDPPHGYILKWLDAVPINALLGSTERMVGKPEVTILRARLRRICRQMGVHRSTESKLGFNAWRKAAQAQRSWLWISGFRDPWHT